MKRLAIITTHPIQYNAPLFRLLAERKQIHIKVFYTWGASVLENKYDPGFGKEIKWDIPLLNGYEYEFLENVSVDKGSHHFNGIQNPSILIRINEYKPDALLIYGWSFKSHLKAMRYFKGRIPVFFRGDSHLLNRIGVLKAIQRKIFLNWVYRYIDIAFYVGQNNYNYFRWAGVPKHKLVFGPHAIDNDRFSCSTVECKAQASAIRENIGLKENDFVFLFAGKLEPTKDLDILIKAFLEINVPNDTFLVIAGNGMLEETLKRNFASHSQIRFMDFQNQQTMPSLYQMADVFVLPSTGETWGLSVNEAMANGKPVIVSNKCGCAEDIVRHGANGYIFTSGNLNELKKILMLMREGEYEKMGIRSREIIEGYSLPVLAAAIENTINKN